MGKKSPKTPQKWHFWLLGKHLNLDNLKTRYAILSKLTTVMDIHETSDLEQKLGITDRGKVGVVEQIPKNENKFTNFQL